jgi:hypothetical protein
MTNKNGRPQVTTPGTGPKIQMATPATGPVSLRRSPAATRRATARRRETAATCRVSLLKPAGRRTRWWYLGACPACGAPHLGRAPDLADVTGTRRLPCRHWVVIVVARTYGRDAAA